MAPVDKALLGKWVSTDGDESLNVQASDKDGEYRGDYKDRDGKKSTLLIRLGKVGDLTLAEIRADDPAPDASDVVKYHLLPLYSFFIVRQTKPQIVFTTLGPNWFNSYVDGHPNELQVVKREDAAIVSSPTADFQAFLLRHYKDEGALAKDASFVRPGDATTRPAAPAR